MEKPVVDKILIAKSAEQLPKWNDFLPNPIKPGEKVIVLDTQWYGKNVLLKVRHNDGKSVSVLNNNMFMTLKQSMRKK